MSDTRTYAAEVYRADGWWMIEVPDLELVTQAENWAEAERMARGVIAADQDLPIADVAVELNVRPDPETAQLLLDARNTAKAAEELRAESLAANQTAARRLHADGWSFRLIGRVMGLTHQRAEQLVKGDPRRTGRSVTVKHAAAGNVKAKGGAVHGVKA